MTLLDTAPDCARCNHPAAAHPHLDGTPADCTGDPRNPCPCPSYAPAADDRICLGCGGCGLIMTLDGPDDCLVCGGDGRA